MSLQIKILKILLYNLKDILATNKKLPILGLVLLKQTSLNLQSWQLFVFKTKHFYVFKT